MLGGRLAGALVPLGVEMQTKQQQEERNEEVRSRARNLRANERRADGCQPREMFKISEQLYFWVAEAMADAAASAVLPVLIDEIRRLKDLHALAAGATRRWDTR